MSSNIGFSYLNRYSKIRHITPWQSLLFEGETAKKKLADRLQEQLIGRRRLADSSNHHLSAAGEYLKIVIL